MRIGSVLENQNIEKRISITPEIAKKYISIGFDVHLIKNYGVHLGISDEEFKNIGVKFSDDENEVINLSNIIVQLGLLSEDKCSLIKENKTLIGVLNPYDNKEKLMKITKPFLLWWIQVVTICFASFFIYTFNWFEALYDADQTKISFLIIIVFIGATLTVGVLSYKNLSNRNVLSNYVWFSSETMVTLGLIGTVAGFLLMLSSAFDNLDVKNVENVQEVITDMSLGMSTALCTTLVGLVSSVLTKIQMVILENNNHE